MRRLLLLAAALLLGCNASPAQVSTMGTTAMGLSSTPGTIVTSPLNGPSPFPATTQPGTPDTTPTNGAVLPLSTPQIPSSPPLGTIQPVITELAGTSIDPTTTVMPTPNTSACAESMTMNLATPGTMAPANATGAAATPGVSPPSSPSGC